MPLFYNTNLYRNFVKNNMPRTTLRPALNTSMKSIAIISDIHGNLPALNVVLNHIKSKNISTIYCLGDLVDFAPWNNEVIETIISHNIPCLLGNHDERVAFDQPIIPIAKHPQHETNARNTAINHSKQTVTEANKAFLRSLPRSIRLTFTVAGKPTYVLLVHASTRSNAEYIYESHDLEDIRGMLYGEKADVLIMGHTHQSYIKYIDATAAMPAGLAINTGSVGRSREGSPLASYLILNIDDDAIIPEIVKLPYPVEEVIKAIEASPIPNFYAEFLKRGMVV